MTTPGPDRGRGRQALFDQALRQQYLTAVADGMRLGEAAAHVGVSINVPRRHARTDPAFAARLDEAQAQGKKLREDRIPHSEAHYNNQHCRHPDCRARAREGRAGRRQAVAEQGPVAEVHAVRAESATSFSLLKAS
ncbi:hypothetical protein [Streptomyces sp. NPDC095613]|uniref:hypothetical protein n=1 Tax=Streptomyces sp. NPDC095613 TaxID=3155540 RepID=UPI003326D5DE